MSIPKRIKTLIASIAFASLAAASVSANPEIGGDYATNPALLTFIDSASSTNPTILTSVQVRCPVAGFLIVQADVEFALYNTSQIARGILVYGITRTTRLEGQHYHRIEADGGLEARIRTGAMQRFDTCVAGQTLTYRLYAYRQTGLSSVTWARRPQLSVIHVRDRY
jgi:hypothetical protein